MRSALFLVCCLCYVSAALGQDNPFQKKITLVDQYIDSFMKAWNIPGLALAVVYKDQLIYARGYGFRDIEKKLPVEPATLFPIASNTKLFTATAAVMLAQEGRLDLDKPVRQYYPALQFSTDELNTKVTLRDMLSHRTGLPRYDGIWAASPFSRQETVGKVIYMKPQLGFREGYLYNNMMFAAAGAVMESVTGMTWEEIIQKKFFQPLNMQSSCFTNEDMERTGNFALAYFEPDSSRVLKKFTFVSQSRALGPAGVIKSNITDISHWMIAQLNAGKFNGLQVIPESVIKQTLTPNNIADKEGRWDELSNALYCLGRTVETYKGLKIATHTGSIDGYYSNMTFVPAERLAIFMVHNSVPAGNTRSMMAFPVIDRLLNLPLTPWSERYLKDYAKEKADTKKIRDSLNATQVKNTVPSHPLKEYAGTYVHPVYGNIVIDLQNNELTLSFRNQRSTLYHFHYDQFVTREELTDKPDFRLYFKTNAGGAISSLSTQPYEDPLAEFIKNK